MKDTNQKENPQIFSKKIFVPFLISFALLAGLYVLADWWYWSLEQLIKILLLGISFLIIAALPLVIDVGQQIIIQKKKPEFDIFSPKIVFSFVFCLMYGIGFIRAYMRGITAVLELNLVIAIGLLAFWVGIFLVSYLSSEKFSSAPQADFIMQWNSARFYKITWAIFAASLLVFLFSLRRTGLIIFQSNLEVTRTQTVAQIGGYAFYIIRSMAIALFFGVIFLTTRRSTSIIKKLSIVILIVTGCLVLLATGYRNGVVVFLIGALIIFHYSIRPLKMRETALMTLSLIAGIAAYALWRQGGELYWAEIFDRASHELALPLMTLLTTVENVPETVPFLYGNGILMTFLALLPGEQPVLGPWLKEQFGLNFAGGGFPPSILGGFYLEFGIIGIIIGMLLLGVILQLAYIFLRRQPTELSLIIYSFLLTYSIQSIRDGLLKDIFPIWFIVVVILTHLLIIKMPRIYISKNSYPDGSHSIVVDNK